MLRALTILALGAMLTVATLLAVSTRDAALGFVAVIMAALLAFGFLASLAVLYG